MIIMALDHTRDYFGTFGANPTDLRTASVALFLTGGLHTSARRRFSCSPASARVSPDLTLEG
jgi:hypothetical protein